MIVYLVAVLSSVNKRKHKAREVIEDPGTPQYLPLHILQRVVIPQNLPRIVPAFFKRKKVSTDRSIQGKRLSALVNVQVKAIVVRTVKACGLREVLILRSVNARSAQEVVYWQSSSARGLSNIPDEHQSILNHLWQNAVGAPLIWF
jgi:hypothetical protein